MTAIIPLPAGACDTHMHFYNDQFSAASTATLFPPNASIDDYREVQRELGLQRVVVVQPTTYGLDNSCQLAAMKVLDDTARGIAVVDSTVAVSELQRLTSLGMRGARFHMLPGGAVDWDQLAPTAEKIRQFGWHIQLQLNGRELADRYEELSRLTVPLVIDHVGRFMPPVPVDHVSFQALCKLIEQGDTWVKLSAPYESSPHVAQVEPLIAELVSSYSDRLLWATNWPHPGQDPTIATGELRSQLDRWLPTDLVHKVLVANPTHLYWRT